MRDKTVYQAYQKGAQYGKFGDHVSQGGKVVKGIDGPIHIEGGVESDIMKEHGPEGEYILMQKQGYESFAEVPVNETTGYKEYSWLSKKLDKWTGGASTTAYNVMDTMAGGYLPGGVNPIHTQGLSSWWDEKVSDPLQKMFGIGEYSEEAKRNVQLEKMLGQQVGSAIAGQKEMEGFIDEQLGEQMTQFAGAQTDVQRGVSQQYGGVRDIEKKTGLITDPSMNLKTIEDTAESKIGTIGSKIRGAETQADIDKAQGKQRTQQALASMLSDFMSVTGETIDQDYMDLFTDYMGDAEGFDVQDYI